MDEQEQIERSELIEAFLTRQLAEEDVRKVEAMMASDASFAEEVETHRLLHIALRKEQGANESEVFRQFLHTIEEEREEKSTSPVQPKKSRNLSFLWIAVAASVILLFMFFWPSTSTQEIFARNLQRLDLDDYTRSATNVQGGVSGTDSIFNILYNEAYKNNFYDKVLEEYEKNPELKKDYLYETNLVMGVTYLEQDPPNPAKAQQFLFTIPDTAGSLYHKSLYYLALAYILQEQNDSARLVLQKIPAGGQERSDADKLLRDLDAEK